MKLPRLVFIIAFSVIFTVSANAGNKMEKLIKQSELYKTYQTSKTGVEIWDDNYTEEGWKYFSIVSNNNGVVRKLEYVRIKEGQLQLRKYDEKGDDLWLETK